MVRNLRPLLICLALAGCNAPQPPDGSTRAGLISGYNLVLKSHDKDGDQRLSRAEVEGMIELMFSRESKDAQMRDFRQSLIDDYARQDGDGDGYLTLDELLREPLATFSCIDTDRDDKITEAEIEQGANNCPGKGIDLSGEAAAH